MKTRGRVQGVQGLCRGLCRHFHSCAGCAGSSTCGRVRVSGGHHCKQQAFLRIYAPAHPAHPAHAFKNNDLQKFNPAHMPAHPAQMNNHRTVTIRCTAENASEVRDVVKADAELAAIVAGLQAQGMFPGLRCVSFTLTGDENTLAQGLGAWPLKNGSEGRESEG